LILFLGEPLSISNEAVLAVVPSVGAARVADMLYLDTKMVEGLALYARFWPGTVRCILVSVEAAMVGFGRYYSPSDLPFEIVVLESDATTADIAAHADDAVVVVSSADRHEFLDLHERLPNAAVVPIIEYTLRTRLAIVRVGNASLLQKLKTSLWLLQTEIPRRRALRESAGFQANGVAAFKRYKKLNPHAFQYFDTRLADRHFIGSEGIEGKVHEILAGRPLRLAFSGRLEPMKGADHLIPVLSEIHRRSSARPTLTIFGSGSLLGKMQADVRRLGLRDYVRFGGAIDFESKLVPYMKQSVDLFLCCHLQGDPSCTYLETMGCGVPIIGYRNEAFDGVLQLGECGVATPSGDTKALANAFISLDQDRRQLGRLIRGAGQAAGERLFEATFQRRIRHLQGLASRPRPDSRVVCLRTRDRKPEPVY
jgi:glycosyltransferase involved in cell wall biosynthesis